MNFFARQLDIYLFLSNYTAGKSSSGGVEMVRRGGEEGFKECPLLKKFCTFKDKYWSMHAILKSTSYNYLFFMINELILNG